MQDYHRAASPNPAQGIRGGNWRSGGQRCPFVLFPANLKLIASTCHPWRPRSPALPHDSPRRTSAFESAPYFRVFCERVGISNPRTQLETRPQVRIGHDFSHADESRTTTPPRMGAATAGALSERTPIQRNPSFETTNLGRSSRPSRRGLDHSWLRPSRQTRRPHHRGIPVHNVAITLLESQQPPAVYRVFEV
jgi:hypothetical protein